ncbi:hypothetical protein [Humisphaera borealis]|uniref:Uncharacterized protein n=1 Tax=Humisphaera borealis TaxID=2807512 RepID=A0A7M2WSB5_9BACT|nr:hypothetical protein [Humisphaera borealis]QOV88174.1 hypothetical protein IPV69_18185 [Humisphaera borealis]
MLSGCRRVGEGFVDQAGQTLKLAGAAQHRNVTIQLADLGIPLMRATFRVNHYTLPTRLRLDGVRVANRHSGRLSGWALVVANCTTTGWCRDPDHGQDRQCDRKSKVRVHFRRPENCFPTAPSRHQFVGDR